MHKVTSLKMLFIFFILTFLINSNSVFAKYSGGDGTANNPWRISSKADLLAMGDNVEDYNDFFVMTNDINMAGEVYSTAIIAKDNLYDEQFIGFFPYFDGTSFGGVFDGNNFKVVGLKIDNSNAEFLGLFGSINGGQIRNLGLEHCDISGAGSVAGCLAGDIDNGNVSDCYSIDNVCTGLICVGGLIGYSINTNISNSYSTSSVTGILDGTGGLIGEGGEGKVTNCYSTGNVNGNDYVGGLIGWCGFNITKCQSTGIINGNNRIGGLVGNSVEYISNSFSSAKVHGNGDFVGGLVGENEGDILNCYSDGSINGNGNFVGGLVGRNIYNLFKTIQIGDINEGVLVGGNILKCYSISDVNGGGHVGGLVGDNPAGNIINCYSTGNVSANDLVVGGLVGRNLGYTNYDSDNSEIPSIHPIISDCYSTSDVNGTGGLIGNSYGVCLISNCFWNKETQNFGVTEAFGSIMGTQVVNVVGLTTAQMQQKSTYITSPSNWDFINTWAIGDNQTYPYLRKSSASDINQDNKVDYFDLAILAENWLSGIE